MQAPYKSNFREELIAAGVLMLLVITGSFIVAYRSINIPKQQKISLKTEADVLGTSKVLESEVSKVVDSVISATPKPTPRPIITPKPTLSPIISSPSAQLPSYADTTIEQPYGLGGEYDNEWYRLTIKNPRLVVGTSRTFKLDVTLANKSVESGLKNRLSATIIKDDRIIAESAPFSLTDLATAYPGEQITFTATLSLVSGTDVSRIKYLPLSDLVLDTVHDL